MRILFLADEVEKSLYDFFDREKLTGVDLIVSCGDLPAYYLEYIVTMANIPLLYVRGNHDGRYYENPPQGCIDIDDKVYDYKGLRIMGLGGCMKYHDGPDMFTEDMMKKRISRMKRQLNLKAGFDILVTHAPARGYGDSDDLPHMGFECFNKLLFDWKPKYMVHGHIHKEYGHSFTRTLDHPSGCRIINACGSYYLDISDDEHPVYGKTGSALYDLYVSIRMKRHRRYE